MADIESRVDKLEEKYSNLHMVVNVMAAKSDATNEKIDNFIAEMREQNKIRADEIKILGTKLDNVSNQTRNITIAAMAGIAAIAASCISIAFVVVQSVMK